MRTNEVILENGNKLLNLIAIEQLGIDNEARLFMFDFMNDDNKDKEKELDLLTIYNKLHTENGAIEDVFKSKVIVKLDIVNDNIKVEDIKLLNDDAIKNIENNKEEYIVEDIEHELSDNDIIKIKHYFNKKEVATSKIELIYLFGEADIVAGIVLIRDKEIGEKLLEILYKGNLGIILLDNKKHVIKNEYIEKEKEEIITKKEAEKFKSEVLSNIGEEAMNVIDKFIDDLENVIKNAYENMTKYPIPNMMTSNLTEFAKSFTNVIVNDPLFSKAVDMLPKNFTIDNIETIILDVKSDTDSMITIEAFNKLNGETISITRSIVGLILSDLKPIDLVTQDELKNIKFNKYEKYILNKSDSENKINIVTFKTNINNIINLMHGLVLMLMQISILKFGDNYIINISIRYYQKEN